MLQLAAGHVSDRRERKRPEHIAGRAYSFCLKSQSRRRFHEAERRGPVSVGMRELSHARDRETQPIRGGNADETSRTAVRAVALAHWRNRSAQLHGLTADRRD